MVIDNNLGKKTELVKRALVNYIVDHKLGPGGKIPSQSELRKVLGTGNAVISRAIQALVNDEILENRGPGRGVFVRNLKRNGHIGRTIGLICDRNVEYPLFLSLMQTISIACHHRNCGINFIIRDSSQRVEADSLSAFRGLEQGIAQHRFDGLISTVNLEDEAVNFCSKNNMPLCYIHDVCNSKVNSVIIEYDFSQLFQILHERNFKRPMLIHMGHPLTKKIRNTFLKLTGDFDFGGLPPEFFCRVIRENANADYHISSNATSVASLLKELLKLPESSRPDVLIIPDDVMTSWIYPFLLNSNWAPPLYHSRIKQLPYLQFDVDNGGYFQVDTMEIAEMTIALMFDMINKKFKNEKIITYSPPLIY